MSLGYPKNFHYYPLCFKSEKWDFFRLCLWGPYRPERSAISFPVLLLRWEIVPESSEIPWTEVPLATIFPLSGLTLDMCFVADPRALVTLGSCRAHGMLTGQKSKGRMTQCGFASSFCFFHWSLACSFVHEWTWVHQCFGTRTVLGSCPTVLAPLNPVPLLSPTPPASRGQSSREGGGKQLSDCGPSCLSAAQRDDFAPSKSFRKSPRRGGGGERRLRRWRWLRQRLWGWRAASEEPAPVLSRWWGWWYCSNLCGL